MTTNHLLEIKDLVLDFQVEKTTVNVLDHISFQLNKGKITGLVGESGCGKSVTSLAVMGLLARTARVKGGEILFDGTDLCKAKAEEMIALRGKRMSMIFQEPMTSLNPVYTVGDQMAEMLLLHSKISKKEAKAAAVEKLRDVAISDPELTVNKYPHQLSGGMRQRVMIAMAMMLEPDLLIADEPTTALDVTIQAQILDLIRTMRTQHNTAILMITHDLGVVAETCDDVIVMYAGQVVEKGSAVSIFKSPTHPYTVGLLKSLPELNEQSERLFNIVGSVPPPSAFPEGCRFAPRCQHAKACCHKVAPELTTVEGEHAVRCHYVAQSDVYTAAE